MADEELLRSDPLAFFLETAREVAREMDVSEDIDITKRVKLALATRKIMEIGLQMTYDVPEDMSIEEAFDQKIIPASQREVLDSGTGDELADQIVEETGKRLIAAVLETGDPKLEAKWRWNLHDLKV